MKEFEMKKYWIGVMTAAAVLSMGGCAPYGAPVVEGTAVNQEMTYETGTIRSVRHVAVQGTAEKTVGTLLGAAAGAALGHTIGRGTGRDVATVAGGLAGAYVGSEVSKANASELTIRTDKGRTVVIVVKGTGYYPGERVRIVKNGSQGASVEPL
jgi:outer membrane lipoprotein SlyB